MTILFHLYKQTYHSERVSNFMCFSLSLCSGGQLFLLHSLLFFCFYGSVSPIVFLTRKRCDF